MRNSGVVALYLYAKDDNHIKLFFYILVSFQYKTLRLEIKFLFILFIFRLETYKMANFLSQVKDFNIKCIVNLFYFIAFHSFFSSVSFFFSFYLTDYLIHLCPNLCRRVAKTFLGNKKEKNS